MTLSVVARFVDFSLFSVYIIAVTVSSGQYPIQFTKLKAKRIVAKRAANRVIQNACCANNL